MGLLTAQRTQSLTNALSDSAGGQVSAVWIVENAEGTVRFAIEQGTFADTIADNLHDILDACDSYTFSGATYKELSDDSIAQQKGYTITLLDGSEIPVTTDVDEEDLEAESTEAQQSEAQTNGTSSENGQSQDAFGTGQSGVVCLPEALRRSNHKARHLLQIVEEMPPQEKMTGPFQ